MCSWIVSDIKGEAAFGQPLSPAVTVLTSSDGDASLERAAAKKVTPGADILKISQ